ncbi:MAG: trypsin-like serine protease [Polyangiaceae bacterium]
MESEARASLVPSQTVRFGFAAAIAFTSAVATIGCFQPLQNAGLATPAAQQTESADRPLELASPFNGVISKDAIVRLVAGSVTCSGTLIGDDLVLTAHHCVSERDANNRALEQDVAPEDISVELGGSHLPWGEVGVRAIVSPDCGYERGEGDIAILVLSRKLVGVPTYSPRIDNAPTEGDSVHAWGYGRCALSHEPVHLTARNSGKVDSLYRGEFLGQAAICPGDSGGPALSLNNTEVVGVISTSVMDSDESTLGLTHFTRLDVWRGLFAAALQISNGASLSELPPFRSCVQK